MAKAKKTIRKKITRKKGGRTGLFLICLLALLFAGFFYTLFLRPATNFKGEEVVIIIPDSKTNKTFVKNKIKASIKPAQYSSFLVLAEWFGYWDHIKPGRYVIKKDASIFSFFRKLNGGRQSPITLTINKFRTNKDLSRFVSTKFEFTEAEFQQFILNNDSISPFGITTQTLMTRIIPNTYEIYWNVSPKEFLDRMNKESNDFWTDKRIEKAKELELSKEEIYTIASIVEEETNNNDEKPIIASVYVNRLKKGMNLGADPTIKFALNNFGLKRITLAHINASKSSPYNTYKHKGLPPGPICTASIASIDAVLKGEKTDYLYFCAKEDFSGSHNFAATAEAHFKNAKKYQRALDSLKIH
ncbi:aminodeoxychorismate lyase [Bacteroidota bacterium]|nr:aminodeoxychorismate lyase [Bacteroidota bacterium]